MAATHQCWTVIRNRNRPLEVSRAVVGIHDHSLIACVRENGYPMLIKSEFCCMLKGFKCKQDFCVSKKKFELFFVAYFGDWIMENFVFDV
jgi:hypothetical protein